MSAAATDYLTHVGSPGTATTLSAPGHTIAGTSLTVASTSNWPTDTGAIFAIDVVTLVDGAETRTPGTYTEWEGVVASSTSITGLVLRTGTDQNYPAGSTTRVYIPVSSARENRLVDGLLVSHNQNGTMITSLPLTTPKVTTSINDSNGNEVIKTPATASAVNELTVTNAATGNAVQLSPTGGDTNIYLKAIGKGTGGFISAVPHKFSAYASGATTIAASGTPTKVLLATELFDTGSDFASSRFTAPIAGFYQFDASVTEFITNGSASAAYLYKNGGIYKVGSWAQNATGGNANVTSSVSGLIQLAASDYVELYGACTQAGTSNTLATSYQTFMDGYLASV